MIDYQDYVVTLGFADVCDISQLSSTHISFAQAIERTFDGVCLEIVCGKTSLSVTGPAPQVTAELFTHIYSLRKQSHLC